MVSALTSADLAGALFRSGNSVTVITSFPNRPGGRIYPGYFRRMYSVEESSEYGRVIRCFMFVSSESHLMSRFLENISFGLTSFWRALVSPRPAAIYANTWPIFAAGLLSVAAGLRRIPIVLSVQDVYPESLAAQGRMPAGQPIMRMLEKAESLIARSASHVIVISEEFAKIYKKRHGVRDERVSVIPNWFDSLLINLDVDTASFRRQMGIAESTFLIAYGGNVGAAAGLKTVLEAVAECWDINSLRFLIAGEGSQLHECKRIARNWGQDQIIFHCPWPSQETSVVLRSANVLMLPTLGEQSRVSVPSKLITYMLAARPVIAQAVNGSAIARIINESRCGWVVCPDEPKSLASQIRSISTMKTIELEKRGSAGREYAMKYFSKESCLPKVVDVMKRAANE